MQLSSSDDHNDLIVVHFGGNDNDVFDGPEHGVVDIAWDVNGLIVTRKLGPSVDNGSVPAPRDGWKQRWDVC